MAFFFLFPILSFARKRKNGKKKKRVLCVGFLSDPRGCGRCAGPSIFLVLGKKDTGEKEPLFACLKGFWALSPRLIPTNNRNRPIFASGSAPCVVVGLGHISPLCPAASASSDADPNCKSPASSYCSLVCRSLRSLWRSVGRYRALLSKPSVRQNALLIILSFLTGAHTGEESCRPKERSLTSLRTGFGMTAGELIPLVGAGVPTARRLE